MSLDADWWQVDVWTDDEAWSRRFYTAGPAKTVEDPERAARDLAARIGAFEQDAVVHVTARKYRSLQ